ncbi:MAG: magnesium-translocating P-type ATPase [Planctomycetia bacterium]|nr:magnesium-translocating P-type ATPase [Planctomycetia bacterium]
MPSLSHHQAGRPSQRVAVAAASGSDEVLASLGTSPLGLTIEEAERRLVKDGPNRLRPGGGRPGFDLVIRAVGNPLVGLLGILSAWSFVSGDPAAGGVMIALLSVAVGLRLAQESRATGAAANLASMIAVHATVLRDGIATDVPIGTLVRGDVVQLAAGDMVPADVRFVSAKDLFVTQAILTGESFPVEKHAVADPDPATPPLALCSIGYEGTSVASGSGIAVVVETGPATLLGGVAASFEVPEPETAFDTGMRRFTWLMISLAAVMTPLVILINGVTKGDWWAALLFGLAVAVGLTPEMLPMVVTVCLSRGALAMARRKVIVKHIDSIQNLGAMDVLCADKTGTLTQDRIILVRHCDVALREDPHVLELARINSHFQTGLRNLLDHAILDRAEARGGGIPGGMTKVDEIPFDFTRRLMSVVIDAAEGGRRLICKGAIEAVLARCAFYEFGGVRHPLADGATERLVAECHRLSGEGFRVLAVAWRYVAGQVSYTRDDERDLVLAGYLAFLDPPKDSASEAIAALVRGGVAVKVLTGDDPVTTRAICTAVGLDVTAALDGGQIDAWGDAELAAAADRATLLARLTPPQKQRVVRLLREAGHVVGFLGDGANDAAALREADVGISVDTAVDLARESADCILLDKDLRVLWEGVREGRRVFVNILKYLRLGASSNFGNMLSMLGAACFLPYLPMTPLQVLVNNLLYDLSQTPIPTDEVDEELIARPRPWSLAPIARFILVVGPVSSIFDFTTFAILLYGFGCIEPERAALFHTGWFVESLVTQTLVIHVIRTARLPFVESPASLALTVTTAAVVLAGVWLPGSALGHVFGFVPLPAGYWPLLVVTVVTYGAVVHVVTRWLVRRAWME